MKNTTKAILFSAFVLPGTGHLILKKTCRGWFYILITIGAFALLMQKIMAVSNRIAHDIIAGNIPLDPVKIIQIIHQSAYQEILFSASMSIKILIACWFIALIDCFLVIRERKKHGDKS